MARLPQCCVMVSVCWAGALLLLPFCWADEDHQYAFDYDATQSPEYIYNSTFDYIFYSNVSGEDLERFLLAGETETDEHVPEEKPTKPSVLIVNQASRSRPTFVLLVSTLILVVPHLLRM